MILYKIGNETQFVYLAVGDQDNTLLITKSMRFNSPTDSFSLPLRVYAGQLLTIDVLHKSFIGVDLLQRKHLPKFERNGEQVKPRRSKANNDQQQAGANGGGGGGDGKEEKKSKPACKHKAVYEKCRLRHCKHSVRNEESFSHNTRH